MREEIFSLTTVKMSSVSTARPKKIDPLAKKIPQNPKYSHVRSTIDTGASITKYMEKIEDIRKNYKYKKDEIFKRMKITTFAQLVIQVHRINDIHSFADPPGDRPDTADLEIQRLDGSGSPTPSLAVSESDYGREPETARSTLERVAGGFGELDLNQPPSPPGNKFVDDMLPYLLLDVRDAEEFGKCHIISAKNYPKATLSRSVNFETKEMLSYKNSQGRIIILVDEDERLAPSAATTLVQRGYDNIFLLSGGVKLAYKLCPDGFITGTPSQSISGVKPKFSELATRKHFTEDDINCLEMHLDRALEDKSVGSRLSKASTASSRVSNMSSRSTVRTAASGSVSGRPAFK